MKRLLIFLIFLISCSHIPIYTNFKVETNQKIIPVYIGKDFSEQEDRDISDIISEWNYALNNQIIFQIMKTDFDMDLDIIKKVFDENNGLIIESVTSSCPFIPAEEPQYNLSSKETAAWAQIGGHKIFIVMDRISSEEHFRGTLRHEIGHILGAGHSDNKNSLMHIPYNTEQARCIDQGTIKIITKYQALKADALNYCR